MDALLWFNEFTPGNNEFTMSNKSEEEIKRLTLEDDLSELKRSVFILNKGQSIQKYAIYTNIHRILLESGAFEKLFPIIQSDIMNQTEENQCEASRSVLKLIKSNEFSQEKLHTFFRLTLNVLTLWNQTVLDNWVLVFNEFLYKLPYESIEKECTSYILGLSEPSQHVMSKYIAARMIGFIADRLKLKFGGQLFDKAVVLCQDMDVEVRKIMSGEVIEKITFAVGKDLAELKMLDKVIELIYDSNLEVKLSSIDLLIQILDLLSDECKRNRITGTLMDFCSAVNEDIHRRMSFQIGKICFKLQNFIAKEPSHINTIQNFYKESAYHKSVEIRKNFVYNLPAMIQFLENKDQLRHIYVKMFKDSSKEIKLKCVSCALEVCKQLCAVDIAKNLRDLYESLLKDDDVETLPKFIPQLPELTEIFQEMRNSETDNPSKEKDPKDKTSDKDYHHNHHYNKDDSKNYLESVLNVGNTLKARHLWRLEIQFMDGFPLYYRIYSVKDLNDKVVPYLIKTIKEGMSEVKLKAIEMLVKFMRINYMSSRSKDLLKSLTEDFYLANSCRQRISYITIYVQFAESFSRQFLMQNMLENVFSLSGDKVNQVRRRFTDYLPQIKRSILPDNQENVQKFIDLVNRLILDPDKETSDKAIIFQKSCKDEAPINVEEDEKKRIAEEDELRVRESKELEDSKKRHTDEYGISRLDYLYNQHSISNTNNRRITTKLTKYNPTKVLGTSSLGAPPLGPSKLLSRGGASSLIGPVSTKPRASIGIGSLPKISTSKMQPTDASPGMPGNNTKGLGARSAVLSSNDLDSKTRKKPGSLSQNFTQKDFPACGDKYLDKREISKPTKKLEEINKLELKSSKSKEKEFTSANLPTKGMYERKASLKIGQK